MVSRLEALQARFQQKQIQEKEEKLLRLYENQQQKAFEKVGRNSAGSNSSIGSSTGAGGGGGGGESSGNNSSSGGCGGGGAGGGKVRQMFDERRQKAGIDKSYPLEPIKTQSRIKLTPTKTMKINNSSTSIRNGRISINKNDIPQRTPINDRHELDIDNNRLIDMMNGHNLNDYDLINEKIPHIGFDENNYNFKKLSNVGRKSSNESKTETKNGLGTTFKKDTKPIVKKTTKIFPNSISSPSLREKKSEEPPRKSPSAAAMSLSKQALRGPPQKQGPPKLGPARTDQEECKYCGRRFATDRVQIHETICGNTIKRKRKIYDATKHRLEGTELERYSRRIKNKPPSKGQIVKKDWRRTHEEFIAAIRSAKATQAHLAKGGKLSDLPPPPPSSNPDYVECPHCHRKFNEAAAERHIPKCATYLHNKPKPGGPSPKSKSVSNKSIR